MVDRPFFRTDLVSQPIDESGQRFVDVTDPDSGETFRFYEVEYAVACAMDGRRDLQGLLAWAREELGVEPSQDEVKTVISTLADLGYLSDPFAEREEVALGLAGRSPLERAPVAAAPAGEELDLGAPGRSPLDKEEAEPPSVDVELGRPGRSPADEPPAPRIATPVEPGEPEIELESREPAAASSGNGVSAASAGEDISVDLSQHLEIGRDDVKEAVRQSQAMAVPEIPDDLAAELDEPEPSAEAAAPAAVPDAPPPTPAAEPEPEKPAKPETEPLETRDEPPAIPQKPAAPKPPLAAEEKVERAEPRPAAVVAAAEEKSSSSVTLWVLIVFLLLLIGGLAYYYFFFLKKDGPAGQAGAEQQETAKPVSPEPSEPPPPTSTLEAVFSESVVTSPGAGKVQWTAEAGAQVEAEAPVAKLRGVAAVERKLAHLEKRLEHYQNKLDRATADGNKRRMRDAQADVERKRGDIEEAQAELAKLVAAAPIAGTVEPLVEAGAAVEEGTELVRITGHSGPEAEFEVKDPSAYSPGDAVTIASKGEPEITAECEVAEVGAGTIQIACPEHTGLESGTAVTLQ